MSSEEIAEKFVKHLEESLVEHLKGEVKIMVKETVEVHMEGINRRLDSLSSTMDTWKNDFDTDRQTLHKLSLAAGYAKTDLQEIGKTMDGLPKKLENKVEQTVQNSIAEAVPQAVSEQFEVTSKRTVVTQKPKRKRFWFF